MQNRIAQIAEDRRCDAQNDGPMPVGQILEELLAQYERRFPNIHIAVVETATAV